MKVVDSIDGFSGDCWSVCLKRGRCVGKGYLIYGLEVDVGPGYKNNYLWEDHEILGYWRRKGDSDEVYAFEDWWLHVGDTL